MHKLQSKLIRKAASHGTRWVQLTYLELVEKEEEDPGALTIPSTFETGGSALQATIIT